MLIGAIVGLTDAAVGLRGRLAADRSAQPHNPESRSLLQADDHVYLLVRATELPLLDQLFTVQQTPPHLKAGRFFGELALNDAADLVAVACLYNLFLDPADAAGTLG